MIAHTAQLKAKCIFYANGIALGMYNFYKDSLLLSQHVRRDHCAFFRINTLLSRPQTSNYVKKFSLDTSREKKTLRRGRQKTGDKFNVLGNKDWKLTFLRSYDSKSRLVTSINEENWLNKNWLNWVRDQGRESKKRSKYFIFVLFLLLFLLCVFFCVFFLAIKRKTNDLIYLFMQ